MGHPVLWKTQTNKIINTSRNPSDMIEYIAFPQDLMCKTKSTLETSCLYFSSFSILLIAIDRYIIIVHPTSPQITVQKVQIFTISRRRFKNLWTYSRPIYSHWSWRSFPSPWPPPSWSSPNMKWILTSY